MKHRLVFVVVVVLALLPISPAPASAKPRFTSPIVAIPAPRGATDTGRSTGGEPRLLVTRNGWIVVSAQFQLWDCTSGRESTRPQSCMWISKDGGRRFHISGGEPGGQAGDDVTATAHSSPTRQSPAASRPSGRPTTA